MPFRRRSCLCCSAQPGGLCLGHHLLLSLPGDLGGPRGRKKNPGTQSVSGLQSWCPGGLQKPLSSLQCVSCVFPITASRWHHIPSFAHLMWLCNSPLCWGQGCSPGRSHESCQGPFVVLFLPLLVVSGGVERLPGLTESGPLNTSSWHAPRSSSLLS